MLIRHPQTPLCSFRRAVVMGIIFTCVAFLMLTALMVTGYVLIHKTATIKQDLPVMSRTHDTDTVTMGSETFEHHRQQT